MLPSQSIQALYVGYFGRGGDPDGYHYWLRNLLDGTNTLDQIAASFSVQPEAKAEYQFLNGNATVSNISSFIDQVYNNLFNRSADADGKAYWTAQLQAAIGNPDAVGKFILQVIGGAQGNDILTINNKVAAATNLLNAVENSGIETEDFVNNVPEVVDHYLDIARDVVDSEVTFNVGSLNTSQAEIDAYIDMHTLKVDVPGPIQVVEVPGPVQTVTVTEYVEVPVIVTQTVHVPVNVPTEPNHLTEFNINSTLPLSSTLNYDGAVMGFGSGNLPTNYAYMVDTHSGVLFGLKAHYRTGIDVTGAPNDDSESDVQWIMPAGAQNGLIGGESGANIDRSHASIDIVLDFGVDKPQNGEFKLKVDKNPSEHGQEWEVFTLTNTGAGWVFLNEEGTAGQGMTSYNGGHVLADSMNFGFNFLDIPDGAAAGTGDVLPGVYDIQLVHLVGTTEVAALNAQMVLI